MVSGRDAIGPPVPRPRLLVVTPWWPATEADPFGSFVRDQARALVAAGADVRVAVVRLRRSLARPAGVAPLGDGPDAGRVRVLHGPWAPYGPAYDVLVRVWTGLVRRAVAREGAWARGAVVVAHTQELAVPAHRSLRRLGLPWVLVAHGLEPDSPRYRRPDRSRAYRAALAAASRVVAVGPGLARHLAAEAPSADVRVVLNGYDRELVERVRAAAPREAGAPRIASVSNLNEGKGVHLTLEALADRARRGLAVPRYDVVGDGPSRSSLEELARRLGLADRVHFHGAKPHDEALRTVAGASAFVLPSAPEACGVAYLEAMALGVAPVAVRGEGPSAFVGDGVEGHPRRADGRWRRRRARPPARRAGDRRAARRRRRPPREGSRLGRVGPRAARRASGSAQVRCSGVRFRRGSPSTTSRRRTSSGSRTRSRRRGPCACAARGRAWTPRSPGGTTRATGRRTCSTGPRASPAPRWISSRADTRASTPAGGGARGSRRSCSPPRGSGAARW